MKKIMMLSICATLICGAGYAQNKMMSKQPSRKELKKLPIVNKKDPVCGMPLRMGVGDTTLYKGDIIGFCSAECKQKFTRNPSAYKVVKK